jgi:YHS domain-containing protein
MKTILAFGILAALTAGCSVEQKAPEMSPSTSASQSAQAKSYPVDWCVVSGEKLGSMGDPVVKVYQGQEVKFCCKHCIEEFEKNPAMYMAKIDSARAGLLPPSSKG